MTVKRAGSLIVGGGLITAILNGASALWPAQVDSNRASYPLFGGLARRVPARVRGR